ncbi:MULTISPECIES: hypothetical protein [unclassified Bosea (in: a-proteobacteria)]|uniref:hypothetical protein n=1 Tax=unclassified Bosea (in: a-proteobacteria) TaxID=2653178 RepID=UPI000F7F3A78|nr:MULTISPECIES: hypothetical protein [unclassified Bosea (in: a-proteobacteria)]RXT33727.1 hypothetical protein B5U99_18225 [Bosea sp. Tri-54]
MIRAAPLRQAAAALVGPTVWAAHFLTIYASESLACRWNQAAVHDTIVTAATLLAVVAILAHMLILRRRNQNPAKSWGLFLLQTAGALDALSLLGIGWAAVAAALLNACR